MNGVDEDRVAFVPRRVVGRGAADPALHWTLALEGPWAEAISGGRLLGDCFLARYVAPNPASGAEVAVSATRLGREASPAAWLEAELASAGDDVRASAPLRGTGGRGATAVSDFCGAGGVVSRRRSRCVRNGPWYLFVSATCARDDAATGGRLERIVASFRLLDDAGALAEPLRSHPGSVEFPLSFESPASWTELAPEATRDGGARATLLHEAHGAVVGAIELEVAPSEVADPADAVVRMLAALRGRGVRLDGGPIPSLSGPQGPVAVFATTGRFGDRAVETSVVAKSGPRVVAAALTSSPRASCPSLRALNDRAFELVARSMRYDADAESIHG